MDTLSVLPLLAGSAWTSGINLYLTMAGLGIAHRMQWLSLPGGLDVLANPLVIVIAIILYVIEFVADKVPYVDSAWDTVHTFIRPVGGFALGYLALSGAGEQWQLPVALLTGGVALDAHLTKATARVAINTSPEPVTNSVASVTEDASVVGIMYLIVKHPVWALVITIILIVVSIWFLKTMFRFLRKIFSKRPREQKDQPILENPPS
jgi:hypothetical protein